MHYISRKKFNERYPHEEYAIIWDYSNKLVIQKTIVPRDRFYEGPSYFLFFIKEQDGIRWICNEMNFEAGRAKAEPYWNPVTNIIFSRQQHEDMALQSIEDVVCSILRKNQEPQKLDLAYVYWDKEWKQRAYYPDASILLGHHFRNINEPGFAHNCDYCTFLRSENFRNRRIEWGSEPYVHLDLKSNRE